MSETKNTIIAISGKGGAGKTVLSTLFIKAFLDKQFDKKLLVIDADPAMGIASALGIKNPKSVGEVREELIRKTEAGKGEEVAQALDYLVSASLIEEERFTFLAMGRTETLGCYCPVNSILKSIITSLSSSFDMVLVDAEAGIEQLNRKVIGGVDYLVIVTDPSQRGFLTAGLIKKIAEENNELTPRHMGLVINRYQGDEKPLFEKAKKAGLEVFGMIPEDKEIVRLDSLGISLLNIAEDAISYQRAHQIIRRFSQV